MKTEARIIRPPNKYVITFGVIGGVVVLIIALVAMVMFWEAIVTGFYIVLGVGCVWIVGTVAKKVIVGSAKGYYWVLEKEAGRKQAHYLQIPHTTSVIDTRSGAIVIHARSLNSGRAAIEDNVIEGEYTTAPINWLDILPRIQTCLIVGPKQGSGKSTMLAQTAAALGQLGYKVLIIDPHLGEFWPNGARLVGRGRDYDSISTVLHQLYDVMDKRYKGGRKTPPIAVVFDEWFSICKNVPGTETIIQSLLTEGRKVGIYLFVGSHTDRAKQIGLDGVADLKDGMSLVYLDYDERTKSHSAEIVFNKERQPLRTPGPIAGGNPTLLRLPPPATETAPVCAGPDCTNRVAMGANGWKTYCEENYKACKQARHRLK